MKFRGSKRDGGSATDTKIRCGVLLTQGRTYLDIENLFKALDAIERWQTLASEAEQ